MVDADRFLFECDVVATKQRYNVTKTGYYCFGASEPPPLFHIFTTLSGG